MKKTVNGHTVEQWKDAGLSGVEIDGEIRLHWNDADRSNVHLYGTVYGDEILAVKAVFPKIKHLPAEIDTSVVSDEARYQVWSE